MLLPLSGSLPLINSGYLSFVTFSFPHCSQSSCLCCVLFHLLPSALLRLFFPALYSGFSFLSSPCICYIILHSLSPVLKPLRSFPPTSPRPSAFVTFSSQNGNMVRFYWYILTHKNGVLRPRLTCDFLLILESKRRDQTFYSSSHGKQHAKNMTTLVRRVWGSLSDSLTRFSRTRLMFDNIAFKLYTYIRRYICSEVT